MKTRKFIRIAVLIIFAAAFVISGFKLVTTMSRLSTEEAQIRELAEEIDSEENLFEKNKDLICWISIKGTEVDYPVMYTPQEPEYYLHRDFSGEYSYSGLPFLDGRCDIDRSANLIIYGHNMKNSTMFSTLLDYEDYDFWKQHKYVQIKTSDEDRQYEIIAAFRAEIQEQASSSFRYYSFTDTDKESEYNEYIENIRQLALYDTGISSEYKTQLVTLSTCSYHADNGRFAVVAKRVK